MTLTPREEDIIIAIKTAGGSIRLTDLAKTLKIRKPTTFEMVRRLEAKGFINHKKYGEIILTKKGSNVAEKLIHRREIIYNFLVNFLSIPEDIAKEDVHKIEHYLHNKTVEKIATLLDFVAKCSGGRPNFIEHLKEFELKGKCPEICNMCKKYQRGST